LLNTLITALRGAVRRNPFSVKFCKSLVGEEFFDDFIWDKQEFLEENEELIENHKEQEIKIMYPEFWDKDSPFHKLRYEFVYKICPTKTPKRLKYKK